METRQISSSTPIRQHSWKLAFLAHIRCICGRHFAWRTCWLTLRFQPPQTKASWGYSLAAFQASHKRWKSLRRRGSGISNRNGRLILASPCSAFFKLLFSADSARKFLGRPVYQTAASALLGPYLAPRSDPPSRLELFPIRPTFKHSSRNRRRKLRASVPPSVGGYSYNKILKELRLRSHAA